jgi:hypothetical protein
MNWKAVQRLTSPAVLQFLTTASDREFRGGEALDSANAFATPLLFYLRFLRNAVYPFLDPALTPLHRLRMIWYARYFAEIWREDCASAECVTSDFITTNAYERSCCGLCASKVPMCRSVADGSALLCNFLQVRVYSSQFRDVASSLLVLLGAARGAASHSSFRSVYGSWLLDFRRLLCGRVMTDDGRVLIAGFSGRAAGFLAKRALFPGNAFAAKVSSRCIVLLCVTRSTCMLSRDATRRCSHENFSVAEGLDRLSLQQHHHEILARCAGQLHFPLHRKDCDLDEVRFGSLVSVGFLLFFLRRLQWW